MTEKTTASGAADDLHPVFTRVLPDLPDTKPFTLFKAGFRQALATMASAPVAPTQPASKRLIGWRTPDYLEETADAAIAKNWSVHHDLLPIFEGDAHTKLATPEAAPVAPIEPFGWVKSREMTGWAKAGGSINLWRKKFDCDTPVFLASVAPEAAPVAPTPPGYALVPLKVPASLYPRLTGYEKPAPGDHHSDHDRQEIESCSAKAWGEIVQAASTQPSTHARNDALADEIVELLDSCECLENGQKENALAIVKRMCSAQFEHSEAQ